MSTANKALMWGAGGVTAVMLALTAYGAVTGDDDTTTPGTGSGGAAPAASPTQPAPAYTAPDEWSEPGQWVALPRGGRTDDHGNDVRFPHTTTGAVAMLAASNSTSVESGRSMVEEQTGIYDSYMAPADRSAQNEEKIKAKAVQTDAELRRNLGIPAEGEVPSGAYARTRVIGYKVIEASRDEVSVYLLSRVTLKAGETEQERGSYTRTVLGAEWVAGDWKLSSLATAHAARQVQGQQRPAMAAPGDAAFNRSGWIAIREAS